MITYILLLLFYYFVSMLIEHLSLISCKQNLLKSRWTTPVMLFRKSKFDALLLAWFALSTGWTRVTFRTSESRGTYISRRTIVSRSPRLSFTSPCSFFTIQARITLINKFCKQGIVLRSLYFIRLKSKINETLV